MGGASESDPPVPLGPLRLVVVPDCCTGGTMSRLERHGRPALDPAPARYGLRCAFAGLVLVVLGLWWSAASGAGANLGAGFVLLIGYALIAAAVVLLVLSWLHRARR